MKLLLIAGFFTANAFAAEPDYDKSVTSFRQTLKALVEAKTVNPPGNESRAVKILAARLKKEGIKYQTMDFAPGRTNLVARLKGSGEKKPVMMLAHLDVVGVNNQTWSVPPHALTEKDGFLYGRGVQDDLGNAVVNLETFINLKRQKIPLKRDVILVFTGDEESGGLGVKELLAKHPDWINAEIAIDEGGGLVLDEAGKKVRIVNLVAAEKTYQDFSLHVKGATGHSSTPYGDNAIYVMSTAIAKLANYEPEKRLLPVTREYFKKRAEIEPPEIAEAMRALAESKGKLPKKSLDILATKPMLAPQLTTTCIPTIFNGGIRENALPPDATVNVNCRILPDESIADVKKRLESIIDDSRIVITVKGDFESGGASAVPGEFPEAVEKVTKALLPGTPVITAMISGATDSRFLRKKGINAYGISALARTEADGPRAHGADERIQVSSIRPGLEYNYKLILELAEKK